MNLLLTGSTGALGAELLNCLAAHRPDDRLFVLLRAPGQAEFAARSISLLASLDEDIRGRVVPVAGDVTADALGLGDGYARLSGEIDEIFHAAACTRFDAGVEEAAS